MYKPGEEAENGIYFTVGFILPQFVPLRTLCFIIHDFPENNFVRKMLWYVKISSGGYVHL